MKIKINDYVEEYSLKNGLKVHFIKLQSHQVYVSYDVGLGSFDQKYGVQDNIYYITPGTAHMIEHLMFAMPEGDAFSYFSKIGVASNAFTTYAKTSYTLEGKENIEKAIVYLLKMVHTPYFSKEHVETEKKIILEEIHGVNDDPLNQMYQTIYGQLYYNYPLKNDILGDENDLYDISLQDIERVYKHFYHLNNTTLFIMGDIDINNMIEILENVNLPKDYYDIKRLSIDEPKVVKNSILTKEFDIEVPLLFVGYKYNISHLNMKERIKLEVMFIILTQLILGNHIEFVDNLIKNELIFDGFDFEHVVEGEYLTVLIYNQTINSELLFQRLHKYLSNDAIKEISEERLDIFKKSYLGTLIVVNDDFETRLHILTKFYKDGILMEQMVELIQSITYDEMIKLFKTFNEMPYSVLYAHSKKHENILD